jgi:TPR repeat protein
MTDALDFIYPSPLQFAASIPAWAGMGDGIEAFKHQEYALALREFSLLADQGDADAQYFLGSLYQHGDGVVKNIAKATPWLEKAAKQGHHGAANALGVIYASEGQAAHDDEQAAEQGYEPAEYALGVLYYSGNGVEKNDAAALHWFSLAAKHRILPAQTQLAVLYDEGQGTAQDRIKAFHWYSEAATQGDTGAQQALGEKYSTGDGVPQDFVLAYVWFNLAGAQGSTEAVQARETLLKKMSATQIEHGQEMSRDYFERYVIKSNTAE